MVQLLIADELTGLEMDGIEVYDAYLNEQVLVIAPLLCIICDNPQASKLVNHLGGSANKYCRFCMVCCLYMCTCSGHTIV